MNNEDYAIINGKLLTFDPVEYAVQWNYPMIIWSLSTEDVVGPKKVNLQFNPESQNTLGQSIILLKSDCKILYGEFEGYITDEEGNEIEIDEVKGQAHVHYLQL